MIKGVHTMFYTSDPTALRAFLRDVLKMRATDLGEGWLIFDVPEAEMGCHPADEAAGAPSGTHNISFYCDDIRKTIAELTARGVEFTDAVADMGYGLVTHFKVPGDFTVQLYQPRYTIRSRRKAGRPKTTRAKRAAGPRVRSTKISKARPATKRAAKRKRR